LTGQSGNACQMGLERNLIWLYYCALNWSEKYLFK
jgi:hypothetical protein